MGENRGKTAQLPKERRATIPQAPVPNLRALLIGIDKYKYVSQLSGAINDAHNMKIFLRFDLSVPESRITVLKNEQATRSGILDALEQLRKDPTIQLFDPILIYYAGHGCEIKSPLAVPGGNEDKAECLVPWDMHKATATEAAIPAIPDYTIAALLDELAAEKGNNITVILDCCHSASSTRGARLVSHTQANLVPLASISATAGHASSSITKPTPSSRVSLDSWTTMPEGDYVARSLDQDDLPPLTSDTDKEILREHEAVMSGGRCVTIMAILYFCYVRLRLGGSTGSTVKVSPSFAYIKRIIASHLKPGRSHVLLAACGNTELAYENPKSKRGFFTDTLLRLLKSRPVNELTYKAIFEDFPPLPTPRDQNPVCEGANESRLFLEAPVAGRHSRYISMKQLGDGYYVLRAGDAQGVIPGSKYKLEDGAWSTCSVGSSNGTFLAQPHTEQPRLSPLESWCDLSANATTPSRLRAKLVARGGFHSFRVCLGQGFNKFNLGALAKAIEDELGRKDHGIYLVDSSHESNIMLDIDHKDPKFVVFQLTNFPGVLPHRCRLDASQICHVLFAMAQWNWHLTRRPHPIFQPNKDIAELTVYQLRDNGLAEVPMDNRYVTIPVSRENQYAFKIKSLYGERLYPYLFYFSAAGQSIRPLYLRVYGSGHVDSPLEPYGELTIGYLNNDMISGPISFQKGPDVGYFRLFLTTSPADFDSMTQPSPFLPRIMHIHTANMPLGNGGEYLDGVEISKLASSDHTHRATSTTSEHTDIPKSRANREALDHTLRVAPSTDLGAPSSSVFPKSSQQEQVFNIERSLRGEVPSAKVMEILQKNGFWSKKEWWGVVCLNVVLTSSPEAATLRSRSRGSLEVLARTPKPVITPWFRTPTITKESLASIQCMRLRTSAKAVGPGTIPTTGQTDAYFEITILAPDGLPKFVSTEPGTVLTFRSHSVPVGCASHWKGGKTFEKGHEIWTHLEVGDCFEVSACARGRGWMNDAQEGDLTFW